MPETIYGPVDDDTLEQQESLLSDIRPRGTVMDYAQNVRGEVYVKNDQFFVSGDGETMPLTVGNGSQSMKGQRQGYKIHVSAHPSQAGAVAQAVLPLFRQTSNDDNPLGGVYHKVSDLKPYTLDENEIQRGKFITIYAKDEEQLKLIAAAVEKSLTESGITSQQHGGGLGPGDVKLGTSDLMSMRFGQFSGANKDQVYVNGKFIKDRREVPCPEEMQEEFQRVLHETNEFMLKAKIELEQPTLEQDESKTNVQSLDEVPEERKPKVSDTLGGEFKRRKDHDKRIGVKFDPQSVKDVLRKGQDPDDPGSLGGSSLGARKSVK